MAQEMGVEEVREVQTPEQIPGIRGPGWMKEVRGKWTLVSESLVQPPVWARISCRGMLQRKME